MKFFADTASLEEIKYCFGRGVDDGITTNPKIMETTGDLSLGFEGASKHILAKYPTVPVSLETDLRGIPVSELEERAEDVKDVLLKQAYELASWSGNVVVKVPICEGGLMVTRELAQQGIKTNVTACMTPYQALAAADAGATYVSLFANRMLDAHVLELAGCDLNETLQKPDWKKLAQEKKVEFFEKAWRMTLSQISHVASRLDDRDSDLIVGSIRKPDDIYRIAKARPQVITIPHGIVRGLENIPELKKTERDSSVISLASEGSSLTHPMTTYTLNEFEKAADSYRK